MPAISPALVYLETIPDVFDQLITENEEPFDGECMLLKAIYLAARGQSKRVVLDGAGGDILLAEGSYIVNRKLSRFSTLIQARGDYNFELLLSHSDL